MSDTPMKPTTGSVATPRWRMVIWLAPLVVFASLAGTFYWALGSGDPSVIPSAMLDKPVPAFDLKPLDGLKADDDQVPGLASTDLATGEVTLVNVWASWCVPCRAEHPQLMALADQGHRIVGINYKDETENARRFLGTLGNPFSAVGIDDKGGTAIEWGVYGVPETFVVDGRGKIRFKHVGPITDAAIQRHLMPAIEAAGAGDR